MSYCRWSSNDFQSDIYCYECVHGGFQIHVAGQKYVGEVPKLPNILEVSEDEFLKAYHAQSEWLEKAPLEPIGLSCDGASYHCRTAEETVKKLIELKAIGYRVPDFAIEALKEEINPARREASPRRERSPFGTSAFILASPPGSRLKQEGRRLSAT